MRNLNFILIVTVCLVGICNDQTSAQTLTSELLAESVDQLTNDAKKFGDPQRGAIAFYQSTMNCAKCHEPQGNSNRRLGPNLSEKRDVEWEHLIESVLQPSAKINEKFQSAKIFLDDGKMVTGVLVKETDASLFVDQIEQPEKPLEIAKESIDEWERTKISSMPEALANQLSDRQQFLDLVSYLAAISEGAGRWAELKPAGLVALAPLPEYESRVDHAGLIRSLDDDSLARGEEIYRLRCASCHGTVAEEGSMPTSLRFAAGQFKNGNDPLTLYKTLTHGYGMMNPQRWMVPQQKYEVIHYLREHFLKPNNESQYFDVSNDYLASLPVGDTRGPKPVDSRPWTLMDYGPSLINTIEVSDDGSNIAQKGIAIRLDDGPGGVESGSHWLMYEHDTMRVAGAWSGRFIDWEGIHFNGTHGRHPRVGGKVHFANPTAPGFGRPLEKPLTDNGDDAAGRFVDDRVVGRDGKHYGPLAKDWARYLGMYRFGKQTIIKYTVADTEVLEMPGLSFIDDNPVYTRTLNIGKRTKDMLIQVANVDGHSQLVESGPANAAIVLFDEATESAAKDNTTKSSGLVFDGAKFGEIADAGPFDMTNSDYSIFARIKTKSDGTIFAQTKNQEEWIPQGITFFLRGGKLALDIGWVGSVQSNRKVNDGKWHDVAMTWDADDKQVRFFVDGKPAKGGELAPEGKIEDPVVRIGFTNDNFPSKPFFNGEMKDLRFYQRKLSPEEVNNPAKIDSSKLVGTWSSQSGANFVESGGEKALTAVISSSSVEQKKLGLIAGTSLAESSWTHDDQGNLILRIRAGDPVNVVISHCPVTTKEQARAIEKRLPEIQVPKNLAVLTGGGPANYPEKLTTRIIRGNGDGPFAVDVFERPKNNPWNCQLRLTGLDFLPDGDTMILTAWDGSVWRVTGFGEERNVNAANSNAKTNEQTLTWQRIASGLFQPLGVKYVNGKIYVTCRDQMVILHDLNGDHETDWYENFNSDHQVTEHFHEFAMGLQTDEGGNFYYAKSARHAKKAVVPHHGTLLKVSPDGQKTEILANGFRAANGVCINPDGSFLVTDQEGHWNPKNRINWVRPGEFYGNMFGYHDVKDDSDSAMQDPLCWITNAFDRSPSELLWVESEKWGPLNGSLLNFSYGYGKVYIVPHESVDGKMQGGMCEFPIEQFPTGVMRGRFSPADGQLYSCGMFAWAGSQQQPGGFYRIRYTGKPVHLPVGLGASTEGLEIKFSGAVDPVTAADASNYSVNTWDLKRTKNYGSKHYNEKRLEIARVDVQPDGQSVKIHLPGIKLTWGMEVNYSIRTKSGEKLQGKIHNSIYRLAK
ncbi:MAG: DUF6797 domain-containing protein [Mariniblastus sp.]